MVVNDKLLEEEFNRRISQNLCGFMIDYDARGLFVPHNVPYDFFIEPNFGRFSDGIYPSDLSYSSEGNSVVMPVFYGVSKDGVRVSSDYLIGNSLWRDLFNRLYRLNGSGKFVTNGDLKDFFASRLRSISGFFSSRPNLLFSRSDSSDSFVKGVLLDCVQDERVISYLSSIGWFK